MVDQLPEVRVHVSFVESLEILWFMKTFIVSQYLTPVD